MSAFSSQNSLTRDTSATWKKLFTLNTPNYTYLQFEWLSSAPRYEGSLSVYLWQPHIEPPIPVRLTIFISGQTETESRNILVLREGWDCSPSIDSPGRHSLEELGQAKKECQELSGVWLSGTDEETATIQGTYSIIYLGFLKLIQDTTLFVRSAEDELAELVGSNIHIYSNLNVGTNMLYYCIRGTLEGGARPMGNYIFCFISMTAFVYPEPDLSMHPGFSKR